AFFSIDAAAADRAPGSAATADPDPDPDAGLPDASHNGVARLDPRTDVRPGSRITLRAGPSRLYFFDPATGEATAWPAAHPAPAPALPPEAVPPSR
ncbi:MAG TPA: hypothetical protein VIZ43_09650, partial [Trebonia sp.]